MWGILWGIWALALSYYDIRFRRLPDRLTLPAAVISLAVFSPTGLAWCGTYLVLAVLIGGIGGGDIKLALPLGMVVAHLGGLWAVLVAMVAASLITVVLTAALKPRRGCPHGPSMLLAATLVAMKLT
ncbi:hypothetical protein CPHO_05600 [Corynebacterium phocae]|uniref:Prepilin type IV endopeptidase peptidase domain-containing protein n=1 Tax=Corynebacterium phocae TaxID=161895 RepID=A0A1L7D2U2_9CORY|nr:prepilin peptidase [Corynebacterium phocae]APT92444.1 hypothetical protein CPHO_05600 [Corynebacterium phocae]KAA8725045.1 prepilin peptidase [Corynebacterium phocae]